MNRPLIACAVLFMAVAALGAQEASQSNSYEGTSTPPQDDTFMNASPSTDEPAAAKPAAARPAAPVQQQTPASTSVIDNNYNSDGGMPAAEWNAQEPAQPAQPAPVVQPVQPTQPQPPALLERHYPPDPDGDIVHPQPLLPGGIPEGTSIHVQLLERLSTAVTAEGTPFRGRVTEDILQNGHLLIPAEAEIDGVVVQVSSGQVGGSGSMLLRPKTIILPDGRRYHLYAELTAAHGTKARVGDEGKVQPASRLKRDEIEYGAVMGTGAITGAVVGGPIGALAGTLVGAGVVTAHLLVSHPQATLEPGTTLVFTLTQPLNMVQENAAGANKN